jgi:hypothetical protein
MCMASDAPDPADAVVWMIRGHWVSLCLRAAVELGVFEDLAESASADELAARHSYDVGALTRLLRVLLDLDIVTCSPTGDFALTPKGQTLQVEHPSGLRALALMQTGLPNLASWHHLADAVRAGDGVYERVNGTSSWEYLAAHPDEQAIFDLAMARRGVHQAAAIRSGCDLTDVSTVIDVGGGKGGMVAALLAAEPRLEAIVADRPDVAAAAVATFDTAGISHRARAVSADFFDAVPGGGDAYVLSNILHDWTDEDAVSILRTVRRAMAAGARLWIVEQVLDAPGRTFEQTRDLHLVDLHMLVLFGARERTKAEYDQLLVKAGYGPGELLATGSEWDVIQVRR